MIKQGKFNICQTDYIATEQQFNYDYKSFIESLEPNIRKKFDKEPERKFKETISLKKFELIGMDELLLESMLADCKAQCPTAAITIDKDNQCMNVNVETKDNMYAIFDTINKYKENIKYCSLNGFDESTLEAISTPVRKKKINSELLENNFIAHLHGRCGYFFYQKNDQSQDTITAHIKKSVVSSDMLMEEYAFKIMCSKHTKDFKEKLGYEKNCVITLIAPDKITVCGFVKDVSECKKEILNFVSKPELACEEIIFPVGQKVIDFLETFYKTQLKEMRHQANLCAGSFTPKGKSIILKGPKDFTEEYCKHLKELM